MRSEHVHAVAIRGCPLIFDHPDDAIADADADARRRGDPPPGGEGGGGGRGGTRGVVPFGVRRDVPCARRGSVHEAAGDGGADADDGRRGGGCGGGGGGAPRRPPAVVFAHDHKADADLGGEDGDVVPLAIVLPGGPTATPPVGVVVAVRVVGVRRRCLRRRWRIIAQDETREVVTGENREGGGFEIEGRCRATVVRGRGQADDG
jgi:hypothetical protein